LPFASEAKDPSSTSTGPGISKIVRVIELAPIENGVPLYTDQSAIDAMGLKPPPGRIGIPSFNDFTRKLFGFEIKPNAKYRKSVKANQKLSEIAPDLFVENDFAGGAGRAGFIEIAPGVWINKKGPGVTGMGRSSPRGSNTTREGNYINLIAQITNPPSPPLEVYVGHADGGATLEEGMSEVIYSRSADAELRSGAARVVNLIKTNRYRKGADGTLETLVTIDRTPLQRASEKGSSEIVSESLAEGNAKRFLKGDYLNGDNAGSQGEWVDFGCTTFTCHYLRAASSQGQSLFHEGEVPLDFDSTHIFNFHNAYRRSVAETLLSQMGIPSEYIQNVLFSESAQDEFESLGLNAVTLKETNFGRSDALQDPLLKPIFIKSAPINPEELTPAIDFNSFYKDAAANYFNRGNLSPEEVHAKELTRLLSLASPENQSARLKQEMDRYLKQLHAVFAKIEKTNGIKPESGIGEKFRQIAHFKLRESDGLLKPKLEGDIKNFIKAHGGNPSGEEISQFIEERVMENRFTTAPVSDANFITRADRHQTDLFIRAFEDNEGRRGLFQYPELAKAKLGEQMLFQISTDGGKSARTLSAEFVKSDVGDYFKISIPHGSMPVTGERVLLTPKIRNQSGEVHFLKPGLEIKGPPMLFNERLGLPPDFTRRYGFARGIMGQKPSVAGWDLPDASGMVTEKVPLLGLMRDIAAHPASSSTGYNLSQILKRKRTLVNDLYKTDADFKESIDQLLIRLEEAKNHFAPKLRKIISEPPKACGIRTLWGLFGN